MFYYNKLNINLARFYLLDTVEKFKTSQVGHTMLDNKVIPTYPIVLATKHTEFVPVMLYVESVTGTSGFCHLIDN